MNQKILSDATLSSPPPIGYCPECRTEILASHPYAWCTKCNEPLPYRINMARRPIIYSAFSIPLAESAGSNEA